MTQIDLSQMPDLDDAFIERVKEALPSEANATLAMDTDVLRFF